ncbi:hypothetical protein G7046_g2928 [Stylonectria norvegica]|nr:hypothetical protein G7046_g2928 [Stylonectria norvegica]
MSRLQNVAIAGGSGNLGQVVVPELLASGFNVTALQRPSSTAIFPEGVEIKLVDFDSLTSWRLALEGQDAFISFLSSPATDYQVVAANAAVEAKGLKSLSLGFYYNTRTAEIADSGNERFQTTNLPFIAKVISKILETPSHTADKYITIASFNISQREILAFAEQVSGETWTLKPYKVVEVQKAAEEALSAGDFESAFYPLLHDRLLKDGADLALKPGHNFAQDVLGLAEESPIDAVKVWMGT